MTRGSDLHDHGAGIRAAGSALVLAQFALLGLIGWDTLAQRPAAVPLDAALLAIAAVALGLWALSANRPGNFNIRPLPRPGGQLIEHGPYRWIRHPMYTALLLAGAAAGRLGGAPRIWVFWLALAAVLVVKAAIEERAMLRRHPAYQDYRRRTKRFLPGIA